MTVGTAIVASIGIICGTLLFMTIIGAILNVKKNSSKDAITDAIIKNINKKQ